MNMNKLIFIADVIDPRYKLKWVKFAMLKMYGDDLGNSMVKELEAELIAPCDNYKKPITLENVNEQIDASMSIVEVEDPMEATLREIGDEYGSFHQKDDTNVDKFLKEDTGNDGVKFDILAEPISIVASKSAFSTGGQVLDAFRSSLLPKVV